MPTLLDHATGSKQEAMEHLLASRHFAKAPLLSAFLRYVWDRSNTPGAQRLTEQEIGVKVFHRRPGYDPGEDNIVRNYARQLRKRLEEYYAQEGKADPVRIDIPRGGYVPVFIQQEVPARQSETAPALPPLELPAHESLNTPIASPAIPEKQTARRLGKSWLLVTAVCLLAAAATGGWFWLRHTPVLDAGARIRAEFWRQLMTPARKTVIVPADTGFVMVQEMSGRTYSLADYESWPGIERYDRVYTDYLKAQKYTSVMDLKLVAQLERLPQAQNGQVDIRSARDLKIEDLSDGNAILLGSIYSNPWIEPFQDRMNFRFIYTPAESRSSIVNLHPLPGEQPSYGSSWNSYSHNTYAVLAFLPNLARTGHVLIIQGLDGAGTEAAANLVLNGDAMRPILEKARRPDGSFRGFEVLIDATSVDSHATSPRILSLRLMD